MLNRIQVGGVRGPISDRNDPPKSKPLPYLMCSVYRSIILHKLIPIIQILKDRLDFRVQDLKVGVGRVPMLYTLKIPIHDI